MLKKILVISGKPGLYELVSQGKNMLIVESLKDKKRMPAYEYSREKIISLSDIAIFTETGEVPLKKVLISIKEKENGNPSSLDPKNSDNKSLREYFSSVLPDFDRDRVYPTDIKKIISWYNLLIEAEKHEFFEETEEQPIASTE